MKNKSLLAQMLESPVEELREEIQLVPIEEVLKQAMEEIGLYVFSSTLDYVGAAGFSQQSGCTGTVTVASDGAPERAKAAVEEIFRSLGIKEFDWVEYPDPGQVSVVWEIMDEQETSEAQ